MNAASAIPSSGFSRYANTPPLNRANVMIGLALSILVHGAFVAWTLHQRISKANEAHGAVPIEVRLVHQVHQEPRPVEEIVKPPPPVKPEKKTTEKPLASRDASAPRRPRPVEDETRKQPAIVVTAPPASSAEPKHLDMNAIHASIKSAVAEVDREYADTPTGQLVAKPLYPPPQETKMGKMIDGTTRPDCKEQVAGMGLLAPLGALATLLDKKDNGCKWR